jgi:23S rRNA pseudouridine1911/1915/1917 synthase
MAVVAEDRGRRAITHYQVQEVFGAPGDPLASLVRCELETGRTHQIRVHLAFVKHPLLRDQVYGGGFKTKAGLLPEEARRALEDLRRQALHATLLQFEHPRTGELMRFESELPPDLARLGVELAMCGSAHRQISQRSS